MSRDLPGGLGAAFEATEITPAFLVELQWPGGTVRAWNGYHLLAWNLVNWTATGHLGGIGEIKESTEGGANGTQISLSGIPTALITEALRNDSQGRRARIYLGFLVDDGFVIDPYLLFDGLIDFATIQSQGETSTITVNLEKEFIDNRTNARRLNHQDQLIDYAGDLGFEYVAALANKQFTWGKTTVFPTTGGGSGGGSGELVNMDN